MLTKGTPLQTLGSTRYNGAPGAGTVVLLAAGGNTKGVILRTCWLIAGPLSYMQIVAGSTSLFISYNQLLFNYLGPGVLIPPGLAISIACSAASNNYEVSADILT